MSKDGGRSEVRAHRLHLRDLLALGHRDVVAHLLGHQHDVENCVAHNGSIIPVSPEEGIGGSWSAYYYNGHIYSSDIRRGFDVLEFTDPMTGRADQLDFGELNVQSQPKYKTR